MSESEMEKDGEKQPSETQNAENCCCSCKKKKIIIAILAIVVLGLISAFAPNVSVEKGHEESLLVRKDASISDVMDSIGNKESVIFTPTMKLYVFMAHLVRPIKPGCYRLESNMSNFKIAFNILRHRQSPVRLTFNNIRTKEELCARLGSQLMTDSATLHRLLSDNNFLAPYGVNSNTAVTIFMPDTYEFYWNVTPQKMMNKIFKNYQKYWTDDHKQKAEKAGLDPTKAIILASIVEEESNLESEKPDIAGLYLNRYHINMPLQADPTVKFAVGDFTIKRVLLKHINDTRNSPYNTYVHKGLPPGPIRIPERSSIEAVLNYHHHNYLYMCAKGSGGHGHDFAVSFGEHKQNAERYRENMNQLGIKE